MLQDPVDQQVRVDLRNAETIVCGCGAELFRPVARIKRVSKLLSPTGEELIVPVQALICNLCGTELNLSKEEPNKSEEPGKSDKPTMGIVS